MHGVGLGTPPSTSGLLSLSRRATNLTSLFGALARRVTTEFHFARFAFEVNHLGGHFESRAQALGETSSSLLQRSSAQIAQLWIALRDNPQDIAPKLLSAVVLSFAVSGGPDADGGAPDLDLLFGIEVHRSILSHSILMGAALETAFLSLLRLVRMVHKNLPEEHDAVWDEVAKHADRIVEGAVVGSGIGMTYHLFVDGTVQRAAFHGLGFSMPMAGHQALILANSLGESLDLTRKAGATGPDGISTSPTANGLASFVDTESSAATLAQSDEIHRTHLRNRTEILALAAALMPPNQAEIVRRHGNWLSALAVGELAPTTQAQAHFIAVARFETEAVTEHERA